MEMFYKQLRVEGSNLHPQLQTWESQTTALIHLQLGVAYIMTHMNGRV